MILVADAEGDRKHERHAGKTGRRPLPVVEIGIAHAELPVARIPHRDRDQAIGVLERKTSQENRVDDGDQAGRGGNPERKRENGNERRLSIARQYLQA
jgi:hypothetical protein